MMPTDTEMTPRQVRARVLALRPGSYCNKLTGWDTNAAVFNRDGILLGEGMTYHEAWRAALDALEPSGVK